MSIAVDGKVVREGRIVEYIGADNTFKEEKKMNDISDKSPEIDIEKMANGILEAVRSFRKMNHLRLMIVGKTGVGKSTLINALFREKLADTGIGKPCTNEIREYSRDDLPISIIDTVGFETDTNKQEKNEREIFQRIKEGKAESAKEIHTILYCISAESRRVEQQEIEWVKKFSQNSDLYKTPLIVVLTNATRKKDAGKLKDIILGEMPNLPACVPVLAEPTEFDFDDDVKTVESYGLEELCDVIRQVLPESVQQTFIANQKASLDLKRKYANWIINTTVVAVGTEAFIPVAFADAAALIPTQVTMLGAITKTYGLEISKSIITWFISSLAGAGGATLAGKFIVANLLKLIPGAGLVVGGAISAATAATLTLAIGKTYIELMEAFYIGEISEKNVDSPENKEKYERIFKEKLKEAAKEKNEAK